MKTWIDYTNHRGVRNPERAIYPMSVRFGTSEYHKEPQLLLEAVDVEKAERREFATKDIVSMRPAPTWLIYTRDTMRQVVTRLEEIAKMARLSGRAGEHKTREAVLAQEALNELLRSKLNDEPDLVVQHTDVFTVPPGITKALGTHPSVAIKWAYMARAAGVDLPASYEEELGYVQWQALQAFLTGGSDGFEAEMQKRWNALCERAKERSQAKFEAMETSKHDEPNTPDEKVMQHLAEAKNRIADAKDKAAIAAEVEQARVEQNTAKLLPRVSYGNNDANE